MPVAARETRMPAPVAEVKPPVINPMVAASAPTKARQGHSTLLGAGALLFLVARRLSGPDMSRKIPLLGVVAALMLVGMSTEFVPIAYHVNLAVLAGIIVGPAMGFGRRQPIEASEQPQVFGAGQVLVHRGVLAGQADERPDRVGLADDVVTGDRRVAAVRLEERRKDPHRGRLAGAVRTEQAEHGAARDGEGDAVDGGDGAETFHEIRGSEHGGVARRVVTVRAFRRAVRAG